jgi:hypothetical protein
MSRKVEELEAAIRELAADGCEPDEAWDALAERFGGWRQLDFRLRMQQRERDEQARRAEMAVRGLSGD